MPISPFTALACPLDGKPLQREGGLQHHPQGVVAFAVLAPGKVPQGRGVIGPQPGMAESDHGGFVRHERRAGTNPHPRGHRLGNLVIAQVQRRVAAWRHRQGAYAR